MRDGGDCFINERNVKLDTFGTFCICIDGIIQGDIEGRIYHCLRKEGVFFGNAYHLLKLAEKWMDATGYPESSTQFRSFRRISVIKQKEYVEKMSQTESVTVQKGKKGTFVVHVQYRQNTTWQGEVLWAEKRESRKFRSALELLKLIDSALDETEMNNSQSSNEMKEEDDN